METFLCPKQHDGLPKAQRMTLQWHWEHLLEDSGTAGDSPDLTTGRQGSRSPGRTFRPACPAPQDRWTTGPNTAFCSGDRQLGGHSAPWHRVEAGRETRPVEETGQAQCTGTQKTQGAANCGHGSGFWGPTTTHIISERLVHSLPRATHADRSSVDQLDNCFHQLKRWIPFGPT